MPIARLLRDAERRGDARPGVRAAAAGHGGQRRSLMGDRAARAGAGDGEGDALAGTRRQRNQGLADFSITDVASFWLLYTLNTHLPQLRHLHEVRARTPVGRCGRRSSRLPAR